METILITGGAGFIGSNLALWLRERQIGRVINLDVLTYAGRLENIGGLAGDQDHIFVKGDIADRALVDELLQRWRPDKIIHLAAESHVDRSIKNAVPFYTANVMGTLGLLEASLAYWRALPRNRANKFRLLLVSTDEVYGALAPGDPPFTEDSPHRPHSPYAASKAAADHAGAAFFHTHGLPVITSHCSNNYGPRQFPEKLIPLCLLNLLVGRPLPLYGDGQHIRDWLYVEDHLQGLWAAATKGRPGETYNFGGRTELTNQVLLETLCDLLDRARPDPARRPGRELIVKVADRPGHDRRYAVNCCKAQSELGWRPAFTFEAGLERTVSWYLNNQEWLKAVSGPEWQSWLENQYRP